MGDNASPLARLRPSYLVIARGGEVRLFRSAEDANRFLRKKPRYGPR